MREWSDTHVTKLALWQSPAEQGPSALEREWAPLVAEQGGYVLLIAGAYQRSGSSPSWTALWWHVGEKQVAQPPGGGAPAAKVARLLSPLAHETRVHLMQAMYDAPKSAAQLSEATGLKGGDLYHHLNELIEAAYVTDRGETYNLTAFGCQILIIVTSIADLAVEDRGEAGLAVLDVG